MALNGISTLANKQDRKAAKIALSSAKRQVIGTPGYREYNTYVGSVSPTIGRPWSTFAPAPHGAVIDAENGDDLMTENGDTLITE
jgi:hypothetical protein